MATNFFFGAVNSVLVDLRALIGMSQQNMRRAQAPFLMPGEDSAELQARRQAAESAERIVELSERCFVSLQCSHIDTAIRRLNHWANGSVTEWSELNTRSRALRDAIETELRDYLYYQYPKDKGQKAARWKTEWEKAITSFPDSQIDIHAAVDCYALGHGTASVFHSMRVAEHGLRALAAERRLKLPKDRLIEWANWQEIIKALDDEIKRIGQQAKAGPGKDAALEFYSGARADLNGFKDEYRNLVMHVRATYDEHQALRALDKVHAFVERLAKKLDHGHKRIKWGKM